MYYLDKEGVFISEDSAVFHRNEEYHESGFGTLLEMQNKHFWYLGRHNFILRAVNNFVKSTNFSAVDLGGGCGGWVQYLERKIPNRVNQIALADSSRVALMNSKKVNPDIDVYQVDLMSLKWEARWDVAFLLDVIEHCPDDISIIKEAAKSLKVGGKLIVTAPALDFFWSYNDDVSKHLRRYNKRQFQDIATETGLVLRDTRYFMFFLSPLFWLSRKTKRRDLSEDDLKRAVEQEHKIPPFMINWLLAIIFKAEALIGFKLPFPWGTSILGVFEKVK